MTRPREAPMLVCLVVFEGDNPVLRIHSFTAEDEARLAAWLTDSPALVRLATEALRLFADLNQMPELPE
jgi:hypothetical protein